MDWKAPTNHSLPLTIATPVKPKPVNSVGGLEFKARYLFGSLGNKIPNPFTV
jgi:hypothetical protein